MGTSFDYVETLLEWWSTIVASVLSTTRRHDGGMGRRSRLESISIPSLGVVGWIDTLLSLSFLIYLYLISLSQAYISIKNSQYQYIDSHSLLSRQCNSFYLYRGCAKSIPIFYLKNLDIFCSHANMRPTITIIYWIMKSSYINFVKEFLMFFKIPPLGDQSTNWQVTKHYDALTSNGIKWEYIWSWISNANESIVLKAIISLHLATNIFVLAKLILVQGGNYNGLKLRRILFSKGEDIGRW